MSFKKTVRVTEETYVLYLDGSTLAVFRLSKRKYLTTFLIEKHSQIFFCVLLQQGKRERIVTNKK